MVEDITYKELSSKISMKTKNFNNSKEIICMNLCIEL